MTNAALVVIDLQNDYFENGHFPLWNAEQVKQRTLELIATAQTHEIPVFLVQHIADPNQGLAPFFNQDTDGVKIHPEILTAAPEAKIVAKHFADSFLNTPLHQLLQAKNIQDVYLCGMMTQNCVTHTALSKTAENYQIHVVTDACTTQNEMLHLIALNALAPRANLVESAKCFS